MPTRKQISEKILFGPKERDQLAIANEIIAGIRPKHWDVAGHPDHDIWVGLTEMKEELKEEKIKDYVRYARKD